MQSKIISKFFLVFILLSSIAHAQIGVNATPNYSVNYDVVITKKTIATPKVRVTLRGADEINRVTFVLEKDRYVRFKGDGKFSQLGSDIVWEPRHLISRLEYEANLEHERRPGVFDSYGEASWFITRTSDLLPHLIIDFRKTAKSETRVHFDLPKDWKVVTAMPSVDARTFRARAAEHHRYEWPTGWMIFGEVETSVAHARDVTVTFAYPHSFVREKSGATSLAPGQLSAAQKFRAKIDQAVSIYEKVIPLMADFMPQYARKFLVVYGKTPMWKGGLSGEDSLFVNRRIKNISHDFSSTLVHEYFHVCQGFKKDKRDGDWLVEGLAEYFSLRLMWEGGVITKDQFKTGVALYQKEGQWGVNLTRAKTKAALYNSVPLVLFTLDEMIRTKTKGSKSLKDVVRILSEQSQPVGTRVFQESAEAVLGESLKKFFAAQILGGALPTYQEALDRL